MRGLRRGIVMAPVVAGLVALTGTLQGQEGPEAGRGYPAARDGSWTTGARQPATWEVVTFDEPGTFEYHCTEHPWAVGEITVAP